MALRDERAFDPERATPETGGVDASTRPGRRVRARLAETARRIRRIWGSENYAGLRRIAAPIVVGVAIGAGGAAFPPTRDAAVDAFGAVREAFLSRPEFRLRWLELEGAENLSEATLIEALALGDDRRDSLSYDVHDARKRIERLGWVETAEVAVRPPQTLHVRVVERRPAAIWRRGGRLALLDSSGAEIAPLAERAARLDLPLLVGDGASGRLVEGLALDAAARRAGWTPIGATRIGGRRWDLDLLDGPRVLLPEDAPVAALERALGWMREGALDPAAFEIVDLRIAHAPTARRRADGEETGAGADEEAAR